MEARGSRGAGERPVGSTGGLDSPFFLDVTTITVDPAYLQAAAARAQSGTARSGGGRTLMLPLVLLGLLLTIAARQTRLAAPAATRARAALIADARERTALSDRLQARVESLRAEADGVRNKALLTSSAGQLLAERLDRLELVVGSVAVRGPGVEITLDDAPEVEGQEDLTGDGTVRDRDLQEVVNALWSAGAEAIAINGLRLSTLTAIREAGEAILVDYRPVSPPYTVAAVGDPDSVEPAFAESQVAAAFHTLRELYGVGFDVRRRERLVLPPAITRLRHATVPTASARASG
ncbi:MAG TPA: DUF881 domain-containing protein [Mycobacteriales bacterium]|nr:DUF881 domain-containing protein [Mycobacteriales bacterium]